MTDFTEFVKFLTALVSLLTALPRHSSRVRSPKRKATVVKTMT